MQSTVVPLGLVRLLCGEYCMDVATRVSSFLRAGSGEIDLLSDYR